MNLTGMELQMVEWEAYHQTRESLNQTRVDCKDLNDR